MTSSIRLRAPRRRICAAAAAAVVLATSALTSQSPVAAAGPAPAADTAASVGCPPPAPGHVTCFAIFRSSSAAVEPAAATPSATGTGAPAGYGRPDLQAAYVIPDPSFDPSSPPDIAIVTAYNDPNVVTNLATYRTAWGLDPCVDCLNVVGQTGESTLPTEQVASWAAETDLDVQMVAATCPTCHITVFEADSSANADVYQAVTTAASMAHYVVMSWGVGDWKGAPGYTRRYLSTRGVAYVASSGDYGYGTPNFPAASPHVLAVGGTTLKKSSDTNNARGWDETVWNSGDGSASGAGCSAFEGQPAWQRQVVPGVCGSRSVVDMSLVADPGVAVFTDPAPGTDAGPRWTVASGTSIGAPIAAALYALAGEPNRYNYPSAYPYYHPNDFTDITSGDDLYLERGCDPIGQCTAQPGYDGPSGIGSPIGVAGFAAVPWTPITLTSPGDVDDFVGDQVAIEFTATSADPLPRIRYAASSLPPGVELRQNGATSGSPTRPGNYTVTVHALSSAGPRAKATFIWHVGKHSIVAAQPPRVVGTAALGRTLHVRVPAWRQDSAGGPRIYPTVHYRWLVDGHQIRTATARSFTIPSQKRWVGRRLDVRVVAVQTYDRTYRTELVAATKIQLS